MATITYTNVAPAGVPNLTKQFTDENVASGHMPVVKLAVSTLTSTTLIPADADGLLVNLGANNDVTITGTVTVTGGLTDTQLRATPVPVSGTVTANTGLSQPLTDAQLRATAVPVSGPLTDAQLRATPVPVSGTITITPSGTQTVAGSKTNNNAGPGATNLGALVAVANAAAPTYTEGNLVSLRVALGGDLVVSLDGETVTVTGPLTDAQLRATAVPVSGPLTDVQLRATAVPVSGTITANAGTGTFATSLADGADVAEGAVADAAIITDANGTISGKLRGLVKWAFERMPAALGQGTMAQSLPVVIASNQSAVTITGAVSTGLSQPLTDAQLRATPVPVSGTISVTGVATAADQSTQITAEQAIQAAVEIVDDWDETNRAAVNLIAGQVAITAGAGAVAANTPRVTHASDDPVVSVLGVTTGTKVVTDANGTIQQYLRGLVSLWSAVLFDATNQLRVSLYGNNNAAGDVAVKVGADGYLAVVSAFDVSVDVTRPPDTTVYTALDAISDSTSAPTSFTASLARNSGGSGIIDRIIFTYSTQPVVSPNILLRIFRSTFTNTNDNSAMVLSDADEKLLLGAIYMGGSPILNAATSLTYQAPVCIPFNSQSIFFSLQTLIAFTPASADVATVRFTGRAFG